MKKKLGLAFIMLCLIVSVGLVFFNFHQASSKGKAGGSHSAKRSSSFSAEGVTFDLLSSSSSGATIFGNVANSKREPQKQVTVTLQSSSKKSSSKKSLKTSATPRITRSKETDNNGEYQFPGLNLKANTNSDTFTIQVDGSRKKVKVKVTKSQVDNGKSLIVNLVR